MKRTYKVAVAAALSACALCLFVGCGPNRPQIEQVEEAEQTEEAAQPETEEAATTEVEDAVAAVAEDAAKDEAQPEDAAATEDADTKGVSLLEFQNDAGSAKLIKDMEEGRIPVACNVLYDQMGALPNVNVTDPDTIKEIYELTKGLVVIGESNWSITDCYHHVIFTLQDGTRVGYRFEGEGLLAWGSKNYAVTGGGPLWAYVRTLQDKLVNGDNAKERYTITNVGSNEYITDFPTSAVAGETVTIRTIGVADAYLKVFVDGEEIRPTDGSEMFWNFVMPAHDVEIEASLHHYVGFGGA